MLRLPETLAAWGSPDFAATLKRELAGAGARLPLQQGLSATGHALDARIEAMLLGAEETAGEVVVRVGVFYAGIVAGCNCADDPTPVEAQPEYCELRIAIDRHPARAAMATAMLV
jgi:hypothetical protein